MLIMNLNAASDEEAKLRAASYLHAHPVIEVWQCVRRVVCLSRFYDR
jgi:hypothetical protein